MNGASVLAFPASEIASHLPELGELMAACVQAGASIGYVLPFSRAEGEAFWRDKVWPAVQGGTRLVLVARQAGRLLGSVQLDWDTPPNQPHRAEVRKLMVHPDARRQGLARRLMLELESRAREQGRWLLTLDTRSGDHAEPLYRSLGYRTVGVIPDYCLDARTGQLDSTTIMYKRLPLGQPGF